MRNSIAVLALCALGCAGATPNVPLTELPPSDAPYFDHAVDLVEDPVLVEGEGGGVFQQRVRRSDFVAVVRITSLSADALPRREAYRLTAKVKNRLKGDSPRELALKVDDDQRGYETVRVNEDRLLDGSFVAFVKWGLDPDSSDPVAHWHLSPNSDQVREKVDFVLRQPHSEPPPAAK